MRKLFIILSVLSVGSLLLAVDAGNLVIKGKEAQKYDPSKKLTIKTKAGTTYKNAQIINISDYGIDITYNNGEMTILKTIPYKDLPVKMQKHFGYDAKKAEAYQKKLHKLWEKRQKEKKMAYEHHVAMQKHFQQRIVKRPKKEIKQDEEKTALAKEIENRGRKVMLKVEEEVGNTGVIAWADSPDATVTTGHYGKVFVYGYHAPQGSMWVGYLYPTGTQQNGYDCFAINPDLAIGIATTHMGQLIGQKK